MLEVIAYKKDGKLHKEIKIGSEPTIAYLCDGVLFKNKCEAEKVEAELELKYYINVFTNSIKETNIILDDMKRNKDKLLLILNKI